MATIAFDSGHPQLGDDLLQTTEALDLTADQRTWVAWQREVYADGAWSGAAKLV